MKVYDQIREMLCDELEEIAKKKELTTNSLDVIYRSVDVLKDLSTINAMEQEYGNGGYSGGYYERYPFYMYDDAPGNSYARGRNVHRDSMGRYSNDGHYSYDHPGNGYSGDTKEELRKLMNTAQNDREREAIRTALDNMGR